MNNFRDFYKQNGLSRKSIHHKREDTRQNRKEKRSQAFDFNRNTGFEDCYDEDLKSLKKTKDVIRENARAKIKKQRLVKKKTNQNEKVRPFVVGIVRHKIHSPPFLNGPMNVNKKIGSQSTKSFAPKNYKFRGPQNLMKEVFMPIKEEGQSPFSLRDIYPQKSIVKKTPTFTNITLRPKNPAVYSSSPLKDVKNVKKGIDRKNLEHLKMYPFLNESINSNEPPIFGKLDLNQAKEKNNDNYCQGDYNKENICPNAGQRKKLSVNRSLNQSMNDSLKLVKNNSTKLISKKNRSFHNASNDFVSKTADISVFNFNIDSRYTYASIEQETAPSRLYDTFTFSNTKIEDDIIESFGQSNSKKRSNINSNKRGTFVVLATENNENMKSIDEKENSIITNEKSLNVPKSNECFNQTFTEESSFISPNFSKLMMKHIEHENSNQSQIENSRSECNSNNTSQKEDKDVFYEKEKIISQLNHSEISNLLSEQEIEFQENSGVSEELYNSSIHKQSSTAFIASPVRKSNANQSRHSDTNVLVNSQEAESEGEKIERNNEFPVLNTNSSVCEKSGVSLTVSPARKTDADQLNYSNSSESENSQETECSVSEAKGYNKLPALMISPRVSEKLNTSLFGTSAKKIDKSLSYFSCHSSDNNELANSKDKKTESPVSSIGELNSSVCKKSNFPYIASPTKETDEDKSNHSDASDTENSNETKCQDKENGKNNELSTSVSNSSVCKESDTDSVASSAGETDSNKSLNSNETESQEKEDINNEKLKALTANSSLDEESLANPTVIESPVKETDAPTKSVAYPEASPVVKETVQSKKRKSREIKVEANVSGTSSVSKHNSSTSRQSLNNLIENTENMPPRLEQKNPRKSSENRVRIQSVEIINLEDSPNNQEKLRKSHLFNKLSLITKKQSKSCSSNNRNPIVPQITFDLCNAQDEMASPLELKKSISDIKMSTLPYGSRNENTSLQSNTVDVVDLVSDEEDEQDDYTHFLSRVLNTYAVSKIGSTEGNSSRAPLSSIENVSIMQDSPRSLRPRLASKVSSPIVHVEASPVQVANLKKQNVDVIPSPKKVTPQKAAVKTPLRTPRAAVTSNVVSQDCILGSPVVYKLRNRSVTQTPSPKARKVIKTPRKSPVRSVSPTTNVKFKLIASPKLKVIQKQTSPKQKVTSKRVNSPCKTPKLLSVQKEQSPSENVMPSPAKVYTLRTRTVNFTPSPSKRTPRRKILKENA